MIARLLAGATLILVASGAPAAGQGTDTVVEITVVAAEAPYQSLRDQIGAHVPTTVPVSWSRIDRFNPLTELLRGDPRGHVPSLRCWVDLSDLRRATLYFAAPGGERFLVRDVALSGRLDEVDQQSLAQVLELSLTALLENAEAGVTRAQAREILTRSPAAVASPPAPVAPRPTVPRWDLALGVFYAVGDIASTLPVVHGPGLDLALRSSAGDARVHVGLWLSGQYRLPTSARRPEVGIRLQTAVVRAGIEAAWWRLFARLGAGADWTHVTPLPGTDTMTDVAVLTAPHWSSDLAVTGAIAGRLLLRGALTLSLALVVDIVPKAVQYQLQDATGAGASPGTHVAFAPRQVRPGLALALAF